MEALWGQTLRWLYRTGMWEGHNYFLFQASGLDGLCPFGLGRQAQCVKKNLRKCCPEHPPPTVDSPAVVSSEDAVEWPGDQGG